MTTSPASAGRAHLPRILFACRANAGRSVASKVLAEHYAGDSVEVSSAGSEPGEGVHAEVADALTALGLDVSREVPTGFDTEAAYDVVITQGCGESCPTYPGARYADWPLDDPKGKDEFTVRRILVDIDSRVRALLADVLPHLDLPPSVFDASRTDTAL